MTIGKIKAFTLAEIMIAVLVIGVITIATIGIQKSQRDYANKFMYYSAFKNLQGVSSNLIATGTTIPTSVTTTTLTPVTTTIPGTTTTTPGTGGGSTTCSIGNWASLWSNYNSWKDSVSRVTDACGTNVAQGYCGLWQGYANQYANQYNNDIKASNFCVDTNSGGAVDPSSCPVFTPISDPYDPGGFDYSNSMVVIRDDNPTLCNESTCSYTFTCNYTGGTGPTTTTTPDTTTTTMVPVTTTNIVNMLKKELSLTGNALCTSLSDLFNTVGTTDCSAKVANDASTFNNALSNFRTTNGASYFNVGVNPILDNNPAITDYKDSDQNPANDYYTMYVDIDGSRGNSQYNVDIMKFKIYRDGTILPDFASQGWTNTKYLRASIRYKSGLFYKDVLNSISYQEAMCESGKVSAALYTGATCGSFTTVPICNTEKCEVKVTRPSI